MHTAIHLFLCVVAVGCALFVDGLLLILLVTCFAWLFGGVKGKAETHARTPRTPRDAS